MRDTCRLLEPHFFSKRQSDKATYTPSGADDVREPARALSMEHKE